MKLFGFGSKKARDNKLQVILCYHTHSFSSADVAGLIKNKGLGFEPHWVITDDEPLPFGEHFIAELEGMSAEESDQLMGVGSGITLADETEELSFKVIHPGTKDRPQVIYWEIMDQQLLSSDLLQQLIHHPKFTAGYCADAMEIKLQSEINIGVYKGYGLKPKHVTTNEYGDQVVDISKNPGRKKLVKGFWLMSCWKMWFGVPFIDIVGKSTLDSFDQGVLNVVENYVITIQLYENPFAAEDKKNRQVQQAFRDHLKMDELERRLR